jgi:hypothetical protein
MRFLKKPISYTLAVSFALLALGMVYGQAFAAEVRPIEVGLIHEAYVEPITGSVVLNAIPNQPPPPVSERQPMQNDPNTVWIPGYWAWSDEVHDFVWVSGIWRAPPPGHQWVSGYWQNFPEGWAYVRGFWTPITNQPLVAISVPPPDPLEEEIPQPPGENFEWVAGYWFFAADVKDYIWVPGEWRELDPNWVLTPAHYVWRPEGYVFIAAYWDWPLNRRGQVYAPVYIERESRVQVVYEPTVIIEPEVIVERLIPYYPNYIYIYQYHFHFHRDFWINNPLTPPWWGWSTWWGFNWHNQWALWWWYTHPGYPQPYWMTSSISRYLPPPNRGLLEFAREANPPAIVTPKGVVQPGQLLNVLSSDTRIGTRGRSAPVLPGNNQVRDRLINRLQTRQEQLSQILRPSGEASSAVNQVTSSKAPMPTFTDVQRQIPSANRVGTQLSTTQLQQLRQRLQLDRLPVKPTEEVIQQFRARADSAVAPTPVRIVPQGAASNLDPEKEILRERVRQEARSQVQNQSQNQQVRPYPGATSYPPESGEQHIQTIPATPSTPSHVQQFRYPTESDTPPPIQRHPQFSTYPSTPIPSGSQIQVQQVPSIPPTPSTSYPVQRYGHPTQVQSQSTQSVRYSTQGHYQQVPSYSSSQVYQRSPEQVYQQQRLRSQSRSQSIQVNPYYQGTQFDYQDRSRGVNDDRFGGAVQFDQDSYIRSTPSFQGRQSLYRDRDFDYDQFGGSVQMNQNPYMRSTPSFQTSQPARMQTPGQMDSSQLRESFQDRRSEIMERVRERRAAGSLED